MISAAITSNFRMNPDAQTSSQLARCAKLEHLSDSTNALLELTYALTLRGQGTDLATWPTQVGCGA